MSSYGNQWFASSGAGYTIDQSVRFDRTSSSYFTKTFSTAQANAKIFSISFWWKQDEAIPYGGGTTEQTMFDGEFQDHGGSNHVRLGFWGDSNQTQFASQGYASLFYATNNGGQNGYGKFQITDHRTAWQHYAFLMDTTQSTGSNRLKIYKNGVDLGVGGSTNFAYDNNGFPNQNVSHSWCQSGQVSNIGRAHSYGYDRYPDGLMAEFISLDGVAAAHTDFGETVGGNWVPKDPDGLTFGTNGFHLKFENASDLGNDSSGNNNDWTAANMGTDHKVTNDTPTS